MNIVKRIVKFIKSFNQVDTKGFEEEYVDFWLAYQNKDDGIVMPYFTDHTYVKYAVGDIVPVVKNNNMIAHYKIITIKRNGSAYGDYAGWDDNKVYHLMFDHIVYCEGDI